MVRTRSETLFKSRGTGLSGAARAAYLEAERAHAADALAEAIPLHEAFLEMVAGSPAASVARSNVADCLLLLGRLDDALREAERAVEIDPTNGIAWATRGECLDGLDRREEALESFRRGVDLDPDKPVCWSLLGDCLRTLGRHEEELEAIDRGLLVAGPEGASSLLIDRTHALLALSRKEEALACLDRIASDDPGWPLAQTLAGRVLYALDRLEEALARLDALPPTARVRYWRGNTLWRLHRRTEALEELERAAALAPSDAHIWSTKANVEREVELDARARASLGQALRSNPPPDLRKWAEDALDDLGPELSELPAEETCLGPWSGTRRDEDHLTFSRDLTRWGCPIRSSRDSRTIVRIDGEDRGSFADAGRVCWHPDGRRYAFAARPRRRWRIVTDEGDGGEYDRIEPDTVRWGPNGQLAFAAKVGRQWHWVLGNHVSPGFDTIEPGSLVFALHGDRAAAVGRRRRGVWDARVVVTSDAELGPYDEVQGLTFSADGTHLALIAEREGERFVVRDGEEVRGYQDVREVRLVGPSGDLAFLASRGERSFMVHQGREGPGFDSVLDLVASRTSDRLAHLGSRGDEWFLVRSGIEEPIRLSRRDDLWAEDLRVRVLACSADVQRIALLERVLARFRVHLDGRRGPRFANISFAVFSPDSRHFAYLATRHERVAADRVEVNVSDLLVVDDGAARLGPGVIRHSLRASSQGFAAIRATARELLRVAMTLSAESGDPNGI